MLSSIFLKTLFEKRWAMLWWSLCSALLVVFVVALFPTFQEALGKTLNDVPDSLKALVGDSSAYATLTGYLRLQVFDQMVMMPIILGIIIGTSTLAGEENEGTLQTLVSLPVRRSKVFVQKLLACMVVVGVVTLSIFVGTIAGELAIGEWVNTGYVLLATLCAWLISMVFTVAGFAAGAITGRRGLAGTLAGLAAFVTFMITTLAEGVKGLKFLDYLSPWHYYNRPTPLEGAFAGGDAIVLAAISVVLVAVSYYVFVRRDIYQR